MSTVWPTILNLIVLASAKSESALAFLARSRAVACSRGDSLLLVSAGAAFLDVSAAATLLGELVWVISVSQVYCGSALLISDIRCDHRYRESSIDLMIAICCSSESRVAWPRG